MGHPAGAVGARKIRVDSDPPVVHTLLSVGRLAQLVRARASHARGHRFESCSVHHLEILTDRVQ